MKKENKSRRSENEQFNARRLADMEDRWDLLDVNAVVESMAITVPKAGEYPVEISVKEKI
jgi:hypothetical protein